jgi:hypothetical protein
VRFLLVRLLELLYMAGFANNKQRKFFPAQNI